MSEREKQKKKEGGLAKNFDLSIRKSLQEGKKKGKESVN